MNNGVKESYAVTAVVVVGVVVVVAWLEVTGVSGVSENPLQRISSSISRLLAGWNRDRGEGGCMSSLATSLLLGMRARARWFRPLPRSVDRWG